jgi:hypothetical protein
VVEEVEEAVVVEGEVVVKEGQEPPQQHCHFHQML